MRSSSVTAATYCRDQLPASRRNHRDAHHIVARDMQTYVPELNGSSWCRWVNELIDRRFVETPPSCERIGDGGPSVFWRRPACGDARFELGDVPRVRLEGEHTRRGGHDGLAHLLAER